MERLTRNIIFVFFGVLFSFNNENNDIKQLSIDELKKDVSRLRKALEKYHPGLYWYTSKEQFDVIWDSLNVSIEEPMSEDQFLKLLLPVIAKIKCAHTLFYPSNDILSAGRRFPLDLKFIDGKGYIMSDSLSQYDIPKGSELVKINGKTLKKILDLLFPSLQAQGGNIGWKYVVLENDFQNFYYYIIEHAESFEIEYIDHGTGQRKTSRVNGSSNEVRRRHWKSWYPKETGAPLKAKFLTDPDVAIITIRSLSRGRYKAYQQDFDKLFAEYFEEIHKKRIKHLIIDIRGNEGGNNPEKVYSYIARQNERSTDRPKNDKDIILPPKNNFQGQVIVLANERSISAQETFVSIFKNNNRGLVIGQPTAGCYKGLCGGKKHRLVLPNSHHEIRIPMHASLRTYTDKVNYNEGEGLPPDFKVEENINDIIAGKDLAMELALSKIKDGLQ